MAGQNCLRAKTLRPPDIAYITYMTPKKCRIIIIIRKKVISVRLGESDIHLSSPPKTPAPQYQPIDRKKRKGKRVEDYSRDRAA